MPQYQDATLGLMAARVQQAKPNSQMSEIVRSINSRIKSAIDSRIYWSDLLCKRIISIPNSYMISGNPGTISMTFGSNIATGNGTTFPVNDVVNTVGPSTGIQDTGYQEIQPGSMNNIKIDTLLYIDAAIQPEVVAVVETTPVSFWVKIQYPHGSNFTITSSSLAGMEMNLGSNYPQFTVTAIVSATEALLINPWGGPSISNYSFDIYKRYATIDPNLKVILDCVDQQQGRSIPVYIPMEKVDLLDPQRYSPGGDPTCLVQAFPTLAGTMQYEIYPMQQSSRQLDVLCGLQWPALKMENDRAPWFFDSSMIVEGAIADALRIKNIRGYNDSDPWFNPDLAMTYEQMFRLKLDDAKNADESKAQRAWQHSGLSGITGGANYWREHDASLFWGNF